MVDRLATSRILLFGLLLGLGPVAAQTGSVAGVVTDKDVPGPVAGAKVVVAGNGFESNTTTTSEGNYSIRQVPPGRYTIVFSCEGYVRTVRTRTVAAGKVLELDIAMAGDITDMEEFVVQDAIELSGSSEQALLQLRFDSPSLLDSIGADLMSRAGASDAASALKIVAGATVKDGKSAVIRGLPDRYVSSQLNGVRLPSADDDKRAVELDQFPSAIIERILVSKTFTPDQQGEASGGAVNVELKGIPQDPLFIRISAQTGFNTEVMDSDFLGYDGGKINFWGRDDGSRDEQLQNLGDNWTGAVGVSPDGRPIEYKWSVALGASHEFRNGIRVGAFVNFFYERDAAFRQGVDDSWWVINPGESLQPRTTQGTAQEGDFKTNFFDVRQATRQVQLGTLATFGVEAENHAVSLTYLFTRTTEDNAILAEDTRGKQFFFPGYDPTDPTSPGYGEADAAPYLRLQTLEYTERTVESLQVNGQHTIETGKFGKRGTFEFLDPELDWTASLNRATSNQPDKRQFGSFWQPERDIAGIFTIPATYFPFKPAANFTLGNLQRLYQEVEEESHQYMVNLELPFEQWTGDEGFLKFGRFYDQVDRTFDQNSFSNFSDNSTFEGSFEQPWSSVFPNENHPITESLQDVDYDGDILVTAWYTMLRLPIISSLTITGGLRFECTEIGIVNTPEPDAVWFPPGATQQVTLNPGDGDVAFKQDDILPSIALEYETPIEGLTVRASYNETVARQTFKELTPILQQEFLGGPIFIGNPELTMSAVKNYDVRIDWKPYDGGLVSASWFRKDIENVIERVQRITGSFDYNFPVNYPEGVIQGFEFEVRQDLGYFVDALAGLSIGANATFIDSEVRLPDEDIAMLAEPNIAVDLTTRDATDAPEYLYNIYLTYDIEQTGTQLSVFYTVQGDTLIAGAGENNGNFVPNLYTTEVGTLNVSLSQRIGENIRLRVQAKNLTDPDIETVYRSSVTEETVRRSFKRGIDLSLTISGEFRF